MSKQLADSYHNFGIMLEAGVPIKRCLGVITNGAKGKYAKAFKGLEDGVTRGNTLTETMPVYQKVFEPLDIMVVQAGESSGELAMCLKNLGAWYLFRNRLKNRIRQGMILPVFVLHIGALIMPIPSVVLSHLSLRQYIHQVLATLAIFYVPLVIITLIRKLGRSGSIARRIMDEIAIHIPVLKKAVMALAISRFTNAFYTLYAAGVPIVECTRKACQATGNAAVARMFQGGAASALAGNDVSAGFSRRLPADYIASWEVGEESGQLEKVTKKLAEQTQYNAEMMFTYFAQWLPRVVYFIVGAVLVVGILRGLAQIGAGIGNMYNNIAQ